MALDQHLLLSDSRNEDGRHSIEVQAAYCRLLLGETDNPEVAAETTVTLARLLQNLYDPYSGLELLDTLLIDRPEDASALRMKGIIQSSLREFDEALAAFDRMVVTHPDNAEALHLRGGAHSFREDYESGIADFNRSLAIDPGSAIALAGRAAAYADNGEHEKALSDYDAAIRLEPENHHHYLGRSSPRLEANDIRGAIEDLYRSIELHEENPRAYEKLGELTLSFRDNDPEKHRYAREVLMRAAELDPDDQAIQMHLGRAEARLGNIDAAMLAFRKSIDLVPELLILFKASLASCGFYAGEINDEPDDGFWPQLRRGLEDRCNFLEPDE